MYRFLALLALFQLCSLTLYYEESLNHESNRIRDSQWIKNEPLWNILVLTWPPGFCSVNKCSDDWAQTWEKKVMTVHGLWPQNSVYQNERTNIRYQKLFNHRQLNDLHTYWPSLTWWSDFQFYDHEYSNHGSIYVRQYQNRGEEDSTFLKKSYFLHTVAKAESLSITFNQRGVIINSKGELANLLPEGINEKHFYSICQQNSKVLVEIRICYPFENPPGQEQIIECPIMRQRCDYPITIKGYKE